MKSYSKINLFLNVSSKIVNKKHKIKSLMILNKKIYDDINIQILITKKSKLTIKNNGKILIPLGKKNLMWILVNKLRKIKNIIDDLIIVITKNIPTKSGLGGGSSNVATTLKILNNIYMWKMSKREMVDIVKNIGSDIPFFIYNQPAFIFGTGEIVRLVNFINIKKNFSIKIILNFNLQNSTENIYKNFSDKYKFKNFYRTIMIFLNFFIFRKINYHYLFNNLDFTIIKNKKNKNYYNKIKLKNKKIMFNGSGSSILVIEKKRYEKK